MDRHHVEGISWEEVQAAHELDLVLQSKYGAHFLTRWFDNGRPVPGA